MSSNPYDASQTSVGQGGPTSPSPVLGIISLVTGILTFVPGCCCGLIGIPMALVAIGTGIAGIVMANQGKASGKGMAIAGVICAAVYLAFLVCMIILQVSGAIDPNFIQERLKEMQP